MVGSRLRELPPAAKGSHEAGKTQPRANLLADPSLYLFLSVRPTASAAAAAAAAALLGDALLRPGRARRRPPQDAAGLRAAPAAAADAAGAAGPVRAVLVQGERRG